MRIGGTETVVSQIIRRIDKNRFRPIIACLYETGELGETLLKEGHDVRSNLIRGRFDLFAPVRLYKLMRDEKVDVLFIINQPITQVWGTLCAVLARTPARITAIRSTGKINRIKRRLLFNALTFPWITKITALSRMHKEYLVEKERINPAQIEIVPNGVNLERFRPGSDTSALRRDLGIAPDAPVAGIVAMLRPEKGHTVFVRAAAEVVKRIPQARFLIIGDGSERPGLEALAQELGAEKNILFLGSRSDIPTWLDMMDVAVLSSHPVVETVSNSVLEYMAMAKPVVSTRVGSLPEMLDDGRTGFLIPPGDWKAMADKITFLFENRARAKEMGQAGRAKVEKEYSVEQMIRMTESLFERLLSNGRKS